MAEKIIKHASYWYTGADGIERTALRGDTVDITDDADLARGERLDAFATDADLAPGTVFADFLLRRGQVSTTLPGSIPAPVADLEPEVEKPGGNDSRDKWAAYAREQGAPESELVPAAEGGLSRDQLRERYGA